MSFSGACNTFFSVLYLLFVALSSAVLFCGALLLWVLSVWWDRRLIALNLFSSFWASLYLWCMPMWSVEIIGRNKMDMSKNYVIVCNHQSQLDILVAYRLFFPFRWVSKAEVFVLPFVGWNMVLNGHVRLKRGDKKSIQQMMARCEQLLRRNISIMMFPEGTRSKTGEVKNFKMGAFILAKITRTPILPMVINNTKDALPKHSLKLHGRHKMKIRILDEIPPGEFEDLPVEGIAELVRVKIRAHVEV